MTAALLLALLLAAAPQAAAQSSDEAPPGNPDNVSTFKVPSAGRFSEPAGHPRGCGWCHGVKAEGGFGPDLAGGRGLTWTQFKRAVRQPWGIMPRYTEEQLPDTALADIYAYIKAQPRVAEPGAWYWRRAPDTAPLGQRLAVNVLGCGQCHEPEQKMPRRWMGEVGYETATFEYFATMVYEHYKKYPKGMMPNISKERFPEPTLRIVYDWIKDLGWRPFMAGNMAVGARNGDQTTYNVTIANRGQKGKGIPAEELTLFVRIPQGTKFVSATGDGFAGTMALAKLGLEPALELAPHSTDDTGHVERPKPDLSGDVAVWKFKKVEAGSNAAFSLTLSGPMNPKILDGFDGSTIYWENPGRKPSGSPPVMVDRDLRIPDKGDHELVGSPSMPKE